MYRIATIVLGVALALVVALVVGLQLGSSGALKPLSTQAAEATQSPAMAATDNQPVRAITVSGEGKAIATPDIVKVDLGVDITNRSLTEARDEAASKMNAVIQKLKALGIADKDIQTINYSVMPQQNFDAKPPVVTGFEVTHIVDVTIRDLNKVSNIVDEVVNVGATNIGGISFTIDDMKPVQAQAREQAMADAKAKADQLAKLAGVTLGPVIAINESGGALPPPIFQRMNVGAAAAESVAPTPIQPGQLEVDTSVTVVYGIQ